MAKHHNDVQHTDHVRHVTHHQHHNHGHAEHHLSEHWPPKESRASHGENHEGHGTPIHSEAHHHHAPHSSHHPHGGEGTKNEGHDSSKGSTMGFKHPGAHSETHDSPVPTKGRQMPHPDITSKAQEAASADAAVGDTFHPHGVMGR